MNGKVRSGITQEELVKWGGQDVFNQALALCNSGDVSDVTYDDETLCVSGRIEQPDGWQMPVRFRLEAGGRIHSECPCVVNQRYGQICPHVVAIGLALFVQEMDEEEAATSCGSGPADGFTPGVPASPTRSTDRSVPTSSPSGWRSSSRRWKTKTRWR